MFESMAKGQHQPEDFPEIHPALFSEKHGKSLLCVIQRIQLHSILAFAPSVLGFVPTARRVRERLSGSRSVFGHFMAIRLEIGCRTESHQSETNRTLDH